MTKNTLTEQEIRRKLRDSNFTAVAKNSGVNYHTLYSFMKGGDARVSVIEKLSIYLDNKENKP